MLAWRFGGEKELSTDTLNVLADMIANGKAGVMELDLEQPMKLQAVQAFPYTQTDYSAFVLIGVPKAGQKLEEVRQLLLSELEKMKRGEFSDELLPSVKNNIKLDYYKSLLSNEMRADKFVQSFVSGRPWEVEAGRIGRINGITKQEMVDFIKRHFSDNYCCVYKRQGEDTTLVKIEKPQITAIPANRDKQSQFLTDIASSEAEPIEPVFVDYARDMKMLTGKGGLPVLYKYNDSDGLFSLSFRYEFGSEDVKGIALAPQYLYYIGTDRKSAAEIKQDFYRLACDYNIDVEDDCLTVSLSGLDENMPQALALLEDFLLNAKGDKASYDNYVNLVVKQREDAKSDQRANFSALQL